MPIHFMEEDTKFALTVAGLTLPQIPAVISSAPKTSMLSELQICGFPFNMSQRFLRRHLSFSPGNMKEGRHYTMVTSLFHHSGMMWLFYGTILHMVVHSQSLVLPLIITIHVNINCIKLCKE